VEFHGHVQGIGRAIDHPLRFLATCRAKVRDQIFRAEGLGSLEVNNKLFNGFFVEIRLRGSKIDEIVSMNENRPDIPFLTQFFELSHIILIHRLDGPAARVSAEDLHTGASQFKGTLDGQGESAGDGDVEAEFHVHFLISHGYTRRDTDNNK
jgi:hypothetical protein